MNNQAVKEWVRLAYMDLDNAEYLYKTRSRPPLEIVSYHCQQSAEKYLKGVIASCDSEPPKIHDLVALNSICERLTSESFAKISDECADLKIYAVQPKYPLEIPIEDYHTRKALKDAATVRDFVMTRFLDKFIEEPSDLRESEAIEVTASVNWQGMSANDWETAISAQPSANKTTNSNAQTNDRGSTNNDRDER